MTPVIMFAFWGRRENVELQLPFIERILAENPQVEFHGWNLANTLADDQYLRSLSNSERFVVRHDFAGLRAQRRLNKVWQHYTAQVFAGTLFVKLDDDVVFLETDRFDEFIAAIEDQPDAVTSALTINNGASTRLLPGLWDRFAALDIPLLDVHKSNAYACAAHDFFFEHWRELVAEPVELVLTEDWLSINCIGMTARVLNQITNVIGRRSPQHIAGRSWSPGMRLGDEGAANLCHRRILRGFIAVHLSFGPQDLTDSQLTAWRENYGQIAKEYLA
jgi:hypothetical protein